MRPNVEIHDAQTGETIVREMNDDEYAWLIEAGLVTEGEPDLEVEP